MSLTYDALEDCIAMLKDGWTAGTQLPDIKALWKEKAFLTFASDYCPKNPELKLILENTFDISSKINRKFKKFISNSDLYNFILGEEDLKRIETKLTNKPLSLKLLKNYYKRLKRKQFSLFENKKLISNGILREFSRVLFGEEKRIEARRKKRAAIKKLGSNSELTRFKGLGEISPSEFGLFIGDSMRLEPVMVRGKTSIKELLRYYMGKNTAERQGFIIDNLRIEEDILEEALA